MPKSNREWAQNKLKMAKGNLDKAAGHVLEVSTVYFHEGVEYVAKNCAYVVESLSYIPTMIDKMLSNTIPFRMPDITAHMRIIKNSIEELNVMIAKLSDMITTHENALPSDDEKAVIVALAEVQNGINTLKAMF